MSFGDNRLLFGRRFWDYLRTPKSIKPKGFAISQNDYIRVGVMFWNSYDNIYLEGDHNEAFTILCESYEMFIITESHKTHNYPESMLSYLMKCATKIYA